MRGSKAKRLHRIHDQLAVASIPVPAKARRMPAWLARYQIGTRPPATSPTVPTVRQRAPSQNPRPRQGGLKAKGRTTGPSEKALTRQQRRQREQGRSAA